jgi:hypothetical protein
MAAWVSVRCCEGNTFFGVSIRLAFSDSQCEFDHVNAKRNAQTDRDVQTNKALGNATAPKRQRPQRIPLHSRRI